MRKAFSWWVPHHLSHAEKTGKVHNASTILSKFGSEDQKCITDVMTGDEKWFSFFQVPHKVQNMVWIGENGGRPAFFEGGFRSPRQMFMVFLSSTDPGSVVMVPKGQNVNATYYIETALESGLKNLEEKKPICLVSGRINLQRDNASCHTAV